MTIKKVAHHRNGICGTPFTVGIVEEQGETVLIVQFDDKIENTAVFNLDKLSKQIIEFGQNSKRGDYYCDEFKRLVAMEEDADERKRAIELLKTAPENIQDDSALSSDWLKERMCISEDNLDMIFAEDFCRNWNRK